MNIVGNGQGGIRLDLPADAYHAHPAVGHSGIVQILRSPAHFRAWLSQRPAPTPAMQFGTAVHMAVLEPERFAEAYAECPPFDRRTKEGKEKAAEWEAANAGKLPLSGEQMHSIGRIKAALQQHAGAARLLASGRAEVSAFWHDDATGVECKARADFLSGWPDQPHTVVDLKITGNAAADAFARVAVSLGYDVQAALYVDGFRRALNRYVRFVFVAVEAEPPHAVAAYEAGEAMLALGRAKCRAALNLLAWCRRNDSWPAYQPDGEIEELEPPRWAVSGAAELAEVRL